MFAAIVLLVLVLGTVVFHFLSPWYFTPIASNWSSMDDTVTLTFVVTGLGFVLCNVFIAYCIIKFRNKEGRRAEYEPESVKMESWLTVLTTIGVAAMLAPGLFIWRTWSRRRMTQFNWKCWPASGTGLIVFPVRTVSLVR